jgi:outer membrane immunogenic protein
MKKLLFVSVALAALVALPASAADISRPPPPAYKSPPPVAAYYNWSGCYIGGHAGGLFAQKDWSVAATGADLGSHDANGYVAGGQVGCNIQVGGGWVFGVQGDYAFVDANGSHSNGGVTFNTQIDALYSVTGRVGYAWDRFLGYVKGGGAWERDNYTISNGVLSATASETRSGYTVGVGAEYAVHPNVTWFVEYNYYDFGTRSNTFSNGDVLDIKETKNVVKGGFNFKFDWGSPGGARY